jgi:hypothetical protein
LAARVTEPDIESFITARSAFRPEYVDSSTYLARVYYPPEKVLVFTEFKSQGQALWSHEMRSHHLPTSGPDGVWYLINPVDGLRHPNPRQNGKLSRRSQESITSFRYALLESDEADQDQWLRLLATVPFKIVAVYYSGGRSVHALVHVGADDKASWDSLVAPVKPLLTLVGADPAALTAVRLSRLPQAWRGERQQRLIYLNPMADGTPILQMPPRPSYRDWVQFAQAKLSWMAPFTPDEIHMTLDELQQFQTEPEVGPVIKQLEQMEVSAS